MRIKVIEDNEIATRNDFILAGVIVFVSLFTLFVALDVPSLKIQELTPVNYNCFIGSYQVGEGGFSLDIDKSLTRNLYQRSLNYCS